MNIGMDQQGMLPIREMKWMNCQLVQTETENNDIQEEINKYKDHRNANGLFKSFQKNGSEQCNENECHANLVLESNGSERVFDDVCSGISRRQGNGDDEISGYESQQHQYKQFARSEERRVGKECRS